MREAALAGKNVEKLSLRRRFRSPAAKPRNDRWITHQLRSHLGAGQFGAIHQEGNSCAHAAICA